MKTLVIFFVCVFVTCSVVADPVSDTTSLYSLVLPQTISANSYLAIRASSIKKIQVCTKEGELLLEFDKLGGIPCASVFFTTSGEYRVIVYQKKRAVFSHQLLVE